MSGEYYQQAMYGRRDIVGLHFGRAHERVADFCRRLHEDTDSNPTGSKVSIRWDDNRGLWIVASSSRDVVQLVIEWIKESEKDFLSQSVERAVQPILILEGKTEAELEEIRRKRREDVDRRQDEGGRGEGGRRDDRQDGGRRHDRQDGGRRHDRYDGGRRDDRQDGGQKPKHFSKPSRGGKPQ
jgi:hypothetical protein